MSSVDSNNLAVGPNKATDVAEEQPSAIREGLHELGAGLFDLVAFWQTFKALWKKPELAVYDPENLLKIAPLTFAAQAAVLIFLMTGTVSWCADVFWDIPNFIQIDYHIDIQKLDDAIASARTPQEKATAEHRKRHYELSIKAKQLEMSAAQAATATGYLVGAWVFAGMLQRWKGKYSRVLQADRAFLYEVTERNFVPTTILLMTLSVQMLVLRLPPGTISSAVKSDAETAVGAFYIIGGIWTITSFIITCRNLSKILGVPKYTLEKGAGDNPVHYAIIGAFIVASIMTMAVKIFAQWSVGNLFMWVRHA